MKKIIACTIDIVKVYLPMETKKNNVFSLLCQSKDEFIINL